MKRNLLLPPQGILYIHPPWWGGGGAVDPGEPQIFPFLLSFLLVQNIVTNVYKKVLPSNENDKMLVIELLKMNVMSLSH